MECINLLRWFWNWSLKGSQQQMQLRKAALTERQTMPLAIHSLMTARRKPRVKRQMMVAIMYFDCNRSCLNLSMYSPNYSLPVTTCARATAITPERVTSRQMMEKESTWSMYLICSPAEKPMLSMLKMMKVSNTYFRIYLDILCQNCERVSSGFYSPRWECSADLSDSLASLIYSSIDYLLSRQVAMYSTPPVAAIRQVTSSITLKLARKSEEEYPLVLTREGMSSLLGEEVLTFTPFTSFLCSSPSRAGGTQSQLEREKQESCSTPNISSPTILHDMVDRSNPKQLTLSCAMAKLWVVLMLLQTLSDRQTAGMLLLGTTVKVRVEAAVQKRQVEDKSREGFNLNVRLVSWMFLLKEKVCEMIPLEQEEEMVPERTLVVCRESAAVQLMLGLLRRASEGVTWKLTVMTLQEELDTALLIKAAASVEVQQQVLGCPEHEERDSTWQLLEHPSPSAVLPSSHPSQGKMTIPSPQMVEQSPLLYFGSVYPPQVQLVGQVQQRLLIFIYPVWQVAQAVRLVQVWQPSMGQVEHVPIEVTPQPESQTEQVLYPMQVVQ